MMQLELLLTLSVFVNRAVEEIKRRMDNSPRLTGWLGEARNEVLLITSWLLGIIVVAVFAPDASLLQGSGISELGETIFTGVIVASGGNTLNWFISRLEERNAARIAPTSAA